MPTGAKMIVKEIDPFLKINFSFTPEERKNLQFFPVCCILFILLKYLKN
jgi:hypothetical protein